jgi:hypothetical protein
VLDARGDPEVVEALIATYVHEESLRDYVARIRPAATAAEREATYQRLWLARSTLTRELRDRLTRAA